MYFSEAGGGARRDAPRIHQGLHAMCGVNRSEGGSGSREAGGRKCHSVALGEGVGPRPCPLVIATPVRVCSGPCPFCKRKLITWNYPVVVNFMC